MNKILPSMIKYNFILVLLLSYHIDSTRPLCHYTTISSVNAPHKRRKVRTPIMVVPHNHLQLIVQSLLMVILGAHSASLLVKHGEHCGSQKNWE